MEKELEKLVEAGQRLGLQGDQLLEYLREKERAERKREEDKLISFLNSFTLSYFKVWSAARNYFQAIITNL